MNEAGRWIGLAKSYYERWVAVYGSKNGRVIAVSTSSMMRERFRRYGRWGMR